jgi:hypothetical protein
MTWWHVSTSLYNEACCLLYPARHPHRFPRRKVTQPSGAGAYFEREVRPLLVLVGWTCLNLFLQVAE